MPHHPPASAVGRFSARFAAAFFLVLCLTAPTFAEDVRPNILLCIADDWGWPHAGVYGDAVVQTPTFDRLAREGALFEHAFISSPSCTPSRNALLTGQYHWRLKQGASLHSRMPATFPVYPLLLEDAGYHVGHWRKSYGPGPVHPDFAGRHPAGQRYSGFAEFLEARPNGAPFCFWLGSSDPHRAYKKGSGVESGMSLDDVHVPSFWPDDPEVRSDIADYYFEVQRFDSDVARAIALLEETGELENTIILMTGDHGMPFPRCKSNLYDLGAHVPLAIRWGNEIAPGLRINDFVSFTDIAPTFLDAAGVNIPAQMTGRSLLPTLRMRLSGWIDPTRDRVIYGMERHTPAQAAPSMAGYPCRALRTDRWLYIRNFEPDRWPAGVPSGSTRGPDYSDCDNSPTKQFILAMKDDPDHEVYYRLCFAKRPAEELYDMHDDPDQLRNLAADPQYEAIRDQLAQSLIRQLAATGDPRVLGRGDTFETYDYFGQLQPPASEDQSAKPAPSAAPNNAPGE